MNIQDTFCPLPWSSVAIRNDGQFRICCHANVSDQRGVLKDEQGQALNAGTHRFEAARNSATLKQVRSQMAQGEWPEACGRCQREESSGLRSKRNYANELLLPNREQTLSKTSKDGSIVTGDHPVMDLDLRFGNKCNLKCRMCGPTDSSAWYEDFKVLNGKAYEAPATLNWHESQEFWIDLERNSTALEHIYVVGGEPLLIEKHYEFLNHLIARGLSARVVLEYNTNLTILPEKALDLWKNFKQVRIGVSVDAHGKLNDFIRNPSRFSVIEKNLERLDASSPNIVVWLACTVSIINFYDLSDLILWKLQKRFNKINASSKKPLVTHHVLHKPEFLNVQCLPEESKAKLLRAIPLLQKRFEDRLRLMAYEKTEADHLIAKWQELYRGLAHHLMARDLSSYFDEFLKYTENLDRIRNEKFQDVVSPEYSNMLFNSGVEL